MKQADLLGFGEILEKEIKTPAAEFVLRFQKCYEMATHQPFEYKREHFIIATRLIKKHGMDLILRKAQILANLCYRRAAWFTRNGWSDFTIEQLSNKWNMILDQCNETEGERRKREFYEMMKKREQSHA